MPSCCAATAPSPSRNKRKIALMCDVDEARRRQRRRRAEHLRHPDDAARPGSRRLHHRQLGLDAGDVDWDGWQRPARRRARPKHEVTIGLVGKYIDLPDAYLSVTEALKAGGFAHQTKVKHPLDPVRRVRDPGGRRAAASPTSTASACPAASACAASRASSAPCKFARENGIPTLGLCLGLQCMVIEYARDVVGLTGRLVERVRPRHRVPGHRDDGGAGRDHRRGRPGRHDAPRTLPGRRSPRARSSPSCTARPTSPSVTATATRSTTLPRADRGGRPRVLGHLPDRHLVEFVELPRDVHPFYVGTQAHPELRSRPNHAHPLFRGLIGAALERQQASRLFEVRRDRASSRSTSSSS